MTNSLRKGLAILCAVCLRASDVPDVRSGSVDNHQGVPELKLLVEFLPIRPLPPALAPGECLQSLRDR